MATHILAVTGFADNTTNSFARRTVDGFMSFQMVFAYERD